MTLLKKDIQKRSETIQNIASHMYTASHRIPAAAESALNEAMAILLAENEECRKMLERKVVENDAGIRKDSGRDRYAIR